MGKGFTRKTVSSPNNEFYKEKQDDSIESRPASEWMAAINGAAQKVLETCLLCDLEVLCEQQKPCSIERRYILP